MMGMLVTRSLVMSPMMARAKALDGAFAARSELVYLCHRIMRFWCLSSGDRFLGVVALVVCVFLAIVLVVVWISV